MGVPILDKEQQANDELRGLGKSAFSRDESLTVYPSQSGLETISTQTAESESSNFIYVFVDTYTLYIINTYWLGQIKVIKVNQGN